MAGLSMGNGFPDVVVTGVAMTTALATDADSTWKRLLDGHSGIESWRIPSSRNLTFRFASAGISWRISIMS